MFTYVSESRADTVRFAEKFAKKLSETRVIAFLGDMGAGKTAFVSGFVKGLGIDCDVSSPTFAICNHYEGSENSLYHFDMYRIDGWDDLYSTGFFDCLDSGAYVAVEWAENIFAALPEDCVIVDIAKISENEREIKICGKGEVEQCCS